MKNQSKFLSFRNVVFIAVLSALAIVIQLITGIPFVAVPQLMMFVSAGISMILTGPAYVLMSSKASKTGTAFLFALVQALYFLVLGQPLIALMFAVGGLLSELVLLKGGYQSPLHICAAFSIYGIFYSIGSYLPYILLKEQYEVQMTAAGYSSEMIHSIVSVFGSPLLVLIAALNAALWASVGAYIGSRMMKKHFRPAGIA